VCIWQYILQNYNYKLHFQNLSIYHILHVSIGTLAAENLDVCTACDPWDSNIHLTMGKDRRSRTWIYILRFSFPRRRRLQQQQEDGESQNMFSWTGWMDGKSFTNTTSFTICNTYYGTCWVQAIVLGERGERCVCVCVCDGLIGFTQVFWMGRVKWAQALVVPSTFHNRMVIMICTMGQVDCETNWLGQVCGR
jgi:hypothetical protein